MNPIEATDNKVQSDKSPSLVTEKGVKLTAKENRVINFFSDATAFDWEDWRWQLRNRIRTKEVLSKIINLTPEEDFGINDCERKLTMSIPPYFASLMNPDDPTCPIHIQCVPIRFELETSSEEMVDP